MRESGSGDDFAWQEVGRDDRRSGGWATLADRRPSWSVDPSGRRTVVRLPGLAETPRAALERLAPEIASLEERRDSLAAELAAEAAERRPLAQRCTTSSPTSGRTPTCRGSFFSTSTVTVASGWVLERDRERLEKLAAEAGADLVLRAPREDENPPVFLVNRRLLRPYQILLEMFGLPAYTASTPPPSSPSP